MWLASEENVLIVILRSDIDTRILYWKIENYIKFVFQVWYSFFFEILIEKEDWLIKIFEER